jgi:hypothetical protein
MRLHRPWLREPVPLERGLCVGAGPHVVPRPLAAHPGQHRFGSVLATSPTIPGPQWLDIVYTNAIGGSARGCCI